MKKKILVYPANTEIGLEIGHAFKGQTHFEVTGASSGPGPADFVFDVHSTTAPNVNDPNAAKWLADFCKLMLIDFVYPAHDQAIVVCVDAGVPYIGSPPETVRMCRSKRATYEAVNAKLAGVVPTCYPARTIDVFVKPNIGQGGKGGVLCRYGRSVDIPYNDFVSTSYLPGPEYTIDCLTDRHGILQFVGARNRNRTANGICVESEKSDLAFRPQAMAISDAFQMRGAWFFQMKEDKDGIPTLLEVSCRPAGSSGFHRANGVNLPLLACYDACGIDVELIEQDICTVAYRSLQTHYAVDLDFDTVYCDVDDTVMVDGKPWPQMVAVLLNLQNAGKHVIFITRGHGGGADTEDFSAIQSLISGFCYLASDSKNKSDFIEGNAIFIDDSHAERKEVHEATGIPTFSPQQAIDIWLK